MYTVVLFDSSFMVAECDIVTQSGALVTRHDLLDVRADSELMTVVVPGTVYHSAQNHTVALCMHDMFCILHPERGLHMYPYMYPYIDTV